MKIITYKTTALFFINFLLVTSSLFILPTSASALSCLSPTEMIDTYISEDQYTIALVEAGEIETGGDKHDQSVIIKEMYKGTLSENETVTFNWDETWQYLCVGGPAEAGTEAIYILSQGQVVQIADLDSLLYEELVSALEEEPIAPEPNETEVNRTLMEQIINLLKQMIGLLSGGSVTIEEPLEPPTTEVGVHDAIIGLSEIEAAAYATTKDVPFRVGRRDGEFLPVTMDYRPGRITAEIQNNIVTTYSVEGSTSL